MAFSFGRKWLEGILDNEELSIKEKAQPIMDGHITVTDGLEEERDGLRAEAEKAADLQKKLDDQLASGEDYREKYEKEHEAFEAYKGRIASEAEASRVRSAYRSLLAGEGISEKRLDTFVQVAEGLGKLKDLKLDENGNFVNADELKKAINDDWGMFKTTVSEQGAKVEKPPKIDTNVFDTMSLAQKMQYANQNPSDPSVQAWLNK